MNRLALVGLAAMAIGCGGSASTNAQRTVTLATTTSVAESGLLDVLSPVFRQQSGLEVKVIAVGSGQALAMGRRGDADVLLTHSPAEEAEFMAAGFGDEHRPILYNEFVLVGPASDPAETRDVASIAEAFARIAGAGAPFVSRGDQSGTHAKELEVWRAAGIEPDRSWCAAAGAGMTQTLRIANERQAYTLADRATFAIQREANTLVILHSGDPRLKNPYSVILVNRHQHPHVHHRGARQFADFLQSPPARRIIAEFGASAAGEPLFRVHDEHE